MSCPLSILKFSARPSLSGKKLKDYIPIIFPICPNVIRNIMLSFHPPSRHTGTGPREIAKFRGWIKGGIQLALCANLCHLALLRKFAFANWIPHVCGMTTERSFPTLTLGAPTWGAGTAYCPHPVWLTFVRHPPLPGGGKRQFTYQFAPTPNTAARKAELLRTSYAQLLAQLRAQ